MKSSRSIGKKRCRRRSAGNLNALEMDSLIASETAWRTGTRCSRIPNTLACGMGTPRKTAGSVDQRRIACYLCTLYPKPPGLANVCLPFVIPPGTTSDPHGCLHERANPCPRICRARAVRALHRRKAGFAGRRHLLRFTRIRTTGRPGRKSRVAMRATSMPPSRQRVPRFRVGRAPSRRRGGAAPAQARRAHRRSCRAPGGDRGQGQRQADRGDVRANALHRRVVPLLRRARRQARRRGDPDGQGTHSQLHARSSRSASWA